MGSEDPAITEMDRLPSEDVKRADTDQPAGERAGPASSPPAGTPAALLNLQRLAGNQAVASLLQRGAAGPADPPAVQRKMNWQGTAWSAAKHMAASGSGSSGVLFVGEEATHEVVVKPGEEAAPEAALASFLHIEAGRSKKKHARINNNPIALAPGLRTVPPTEATTMKTKLQSLLPKVGANQDRAKKLVGKITDPGLVVQDLAAGATGGKVTDLDKVLKSLPPEAHLAMKTTKTKKKGFFGKSKTTTAEGFSDISALSIFADPRGVTALGLGAAVDVFQGNFDRVIGKFNPQNMMVGGTAIAMIDNIETDPRAYFRDTPIGANGEPPLSVDDAFTSWTKSKFVQDFAAGRIGELADNAWKGITDKGSGLVHQVVAPVGEQAKVQAWKDAGQDYEAYSKRRADALAAETVFVPTKEERETVSKADNAARKAREAARGNLDQVLAGHEQLFKKHFQAGLADGKKRIMKALDGLLKSKSKLIAVVGKEHADQVKHAIELRRDYLAKGGK